MKTVFKFIIAAILIAILVFIAGITVFTKAVNPNDFKAAIDDYVFQKTGRYLVINGRASWSFLPWLGVHLTQVELTNPAGFTGPNLADIGEVRLKVRFWPLLKGEVRLGKVVIKDADINFIINNAGQKNWSDWQQPPTSVANPPSSTATTVTAVSNTISKEVKKKITWDSFHIAGVDIKHSIIHIINQKDNRTTTFHAFDVNTTSIKAANFFAMTIKFTLQSSTHSNIRIPTVLAADIDIDPEQRTFQLVNVDLKAITLRPNLPNIVCYLQGNISVNVPQQTLTFDPLAIQIVNIAMTGKMQVTQLLQNPNMTMTLNTQGADIEPFMNVIYGKPLLKGHLSFTANLNSMGNTLAELTQNLNGNGNLAILDGALIGFNVKDILAKGQAAFNHQPIANSNEPAQTDFSHLTANYTITQGIMRNDDLSLLDGEISLNGAGNINLVAKSIAYNLTAQYAPANAPGQPPFVVPVVISGDLTSPQVKPDFSGVIKRVVTNAIEQKIQKLTGQKIQLNKTNP